jgi:hypothetical protein
VLGTDNANPLKIAEVFMRRGDADRSTLGAFARFLRRGASPSSRRRGSTLKALLRS